MLICRFFSDLRINARFTFSRFFDATPLLFRDCTLFSLSFSLVHDESQKHFKRAWFLDMNMKDV